LLSGAAEGQSLEDRVARLEQILAGESLSELVLEVQRLKRELRELRGDLELQQHRLETLAKPLAQGPALPGAAVGEAAKPAARVADPPMPMSRELPPAERPTPPRPAGTLSAPKAAVPLPGEEEAYRQAFDQIEQGRFEQAQADFAALLVRYPEGFYADSAHFWLGEASYVQQDYSRALGAFERVIADYPDSPRVPGALLKIGYIQDAQGESAKARETLQRLVGQYAGTTEARLANNRLDKLPK
jgi:tol-pal system protein YbgF